MTTKDKTKIWMVLLALLVLIGSLKPVTTYAVTGGLGVFLYWPGDFSSNGGFPQNTYTDIQVYSEEYPDAGSMNKVTNIQPEIFYIVTIPGLDAATASRKSYDLTLTLKEKNNDAPELKLPTNNYYLPVRVTWTANDGRQCDIFIIAIPEIRDYSKADFSKPAQMYLDLLLGNELDDFYNSLAATKKGVAGGYYIDNYRCLMRILNSTNWLRAGFLDSYKDYYSKSEDALAEVQQTLNQGCWFSPEQATAWFTDVLGYYWEYCEARIEEPELLSLQVMGVDAVKVSESEYSLCLPEGVNWKKASSSIEYRANTINVFEAKGNWTPGAGIMLLLSARDPATNTVYNSGANGYVQGSYYLRLSSSTDAPEFSVHSFQINDRMASIDEKNLTISLHFAKNWSWEQIPQITRSGTGYKFLDADGKTVEPDEKGQIDFSKAKMLRLYEDLTSYAQAGKDTEGLSYHKDYELNFTRGNSAECELLSYSVGVAGEQIDWSADGKTITVTIPYATDWNTLKSSYTISYDATIAMPHGEDFEHSETTPIQYTVTAENGKDQQTYSVIVKKVPPATGNEIESFYCGSLEGTIDNDAKTITLELPEGSTKRFAPQITISEFAVVEPASGVLQDFTEPVPYTVTAQNGETKRYTVTVTVSTQWQENPDKSKYESLLNTIINKYRNSASDDWEWMQLGIYENKRQSDGPNTNNGFDIAKEIKDLNVGPKGRMTDIARLTMLLTSRGYDCSNLAKYNDDKPFLDRSNNEIDNLVANIASTNDGGVNGRVFALCALDMGNYTLPANGARSRESLLEELLNHKYGSDNFGVDMVGMLMYAIAPYQDDLTYGERTKTKLDEGVEAILKEMREDYTFHSWGTVNSESAAQVICALASCGIDPYSDPRFGDGDRTILTQWMDMFSTPDGFKHVQSEPASNLMATYQSCYALQWYLGFLENDGKPYYLYYRRYDFSTVLSSEANILEFSIEGQKGVFGEENGQNTISITLPKGMPLQNITPDFTLSAGAILEAPTIPVTLAEGAAQPFTVLAEDGQTRKTYYVTVTFGDVDPAGAKLDTSTIVLQDANQRNLDILDKAITEKEDGADILLTVSSGIDVTKLRVIANISYRASASPVLDGSVNLDLSDWTEFTITSADGKNHAAYRIKVQAKTVASITAFSLTINGTVYDGDIDDVSGTISVTGVDDSNLTTTKFAPDITLGAGTTVCSPLSGTEQDFSAPVTYTVAGRDVESRTYTVRVTNTAGSLISASGETPTPSSSARIEKFTVLGVDGEIDHTAGTIEVVLPNGTDVTAVAPVVTVPAGAVVSPVSGEVVNLSTPLTYTVRLGSETRYYVVRVVYQRSTSQQLWDKVSEDNTVTDHQESRSTHRFS